MEIFRVFKPKVKPDGIVWINIGDAYNTPVNWRPDDRDYSSLGPGKTGLDEDNSAYVKPRAHRKAYLRKPAAPWLTYGNLLALPYRMVIGMCDDGKPKPARRFKQPERRTTRNLRRFLRRHRRTRSIFAAPDKSAPSIRSGYVGAVMATASCRSQTGRRQDR